jgi:hypothetical protein
MAKKHGGGSLSRSANGVAPLLFAKVLYEMTSSPEVDWNLNKKWDTIFLKLILMI